MKHPPVIVVVIAHMEGPLKGQIQRFSQSEIIIGRYPSCHVRFPAKLTTISRDHAKIIREGNRFKLIDNSSNGTFVNGKRIQEAWLKEGDVLTIAERGPQIGFMTEISAIPGESEDIAPLSQPISPPIATREALTSSPPLPRSKPSPTKVNVPLIIQYGPTLRSFKEVPITIGKNPECDFKLDHLFILDQHAQIFFSEETYWIKDLTGQKQIRKNGKPIDTQTLLRTNDEVAMTEKGPFFRFLGGGRLAEVEKMSEENR